MRGGDASDPIKWGAFEIKYWFSIITELTHHPADRLIVIKGSNKPENVSNEHHLFLFKKPIQNIICHEIK